MPWYQHWFNSPYYHLLYHHRNDQEAQLFIKNLIQFLHPDSKALFLDIACGKGRHALFLNQQGFDVTGIDLSEESIAFAKQFESNSLNFFVHDMLKPWCVNRFDIALNLFTSFGYFEHEKQHLQALKNFQQALKPHGIFVFDYFNTEKIMLNLVPQEKKTVQGIDFYITKNVKDQKIIKTIKFNDKGKDFLFEERVTAFTIPQLQSLLLKTGFEIQYTFGNYALEPYLPASSERIIFICKSTRI